MNDLLKQDLEVSMEEGFQVNDLASANWCFRKLHALNEKQNEINDVADAEIQRINSWKESESKGIADQKEFFEGLLTVYYNKQKEVDKKFKLKTPYGSVTQRTTKNIVYDESTMLSYLKSNHPELIQTVEKFSKTEVKKLIKGNIDMKTGEMLDWVEPIETVSTTIKAE